jgi:hypothetical protein
MKTRLLKKLRKKYSSYFLIEEDPTHEFGCNYIVYSKVALTYHARNMENALEWVREHVHKLMQNYIDIKKCKHAIYNANGEKIK